MLYRFSFGNSNGDSQSVVCSGEIDGNDAIQTVPLHVLNDVKGAFQLLVVEEIVKSFLAVLLCQQHLGSSSISLPRAETPGQFG